MNGWRGAATHVAMSLLVAGFSLGVAISWSNRADYLVMGVLLAMACVGEWVEVRLGPHGALTLRPVLAFIGLWLGGPAFLLVVGLVPIVLVGVVARRSALSGVLTTAGADAVSLWLGYLAYASVSAQIAWGDGRFQVGEPISRMLGVLAYWVSQVSLQALNLHLQEGIRFRVNVGFLARHAWAHVLALSLAAVALGYVGEAFGLAVMAIAGVVLVEAYYPWKLLGDQSGVLMTSLQMMAQAVDLKDPYTSNHSQRVARYATRLAREMGFPEEEVERIRIGALLHDIGKIGISSSIIRKPEKLSPDEEAIMRRHPSVSADIMENLEILGESARIVRYHHEHVDGSGYPDGLEGDEIPRGSRVILVADALDALTTDRPYRKGVTFQQAMRVLRNAAGKQFDRTVVDALERILPSLSRT